LYRTRDARIMKKFLPILAVLLIIPGCSHQIPDKRDVKIFLKTAVESAKSFDKTLIIEFWAPECGPCIRLKRDIFENDQTRKLLGDNFYIVPLSPSDSIYRKLWDHFHLAYQSTVIFIDKSGKEVDRTVSYDGNRDLYINFLKDVASGQNLFADLYPACQKDPSDVKLNYLLAGKYFFRYQLKEAIAQYSKVLELDPENKDGFSSECRYKIAECDLMQNGTLDRMKEYIKEESGTKFAPKAYEYLINDLISKKDTLKCIEMCQDAIDKHPESWEILNKYAWAICNFKIKQDYNKALSMVQKSIELNPYRSGTYSTEAWIHFEMGNKDKAIELQKKAIEIYPNPSYYKDLEIFTVAKQKI
jgi:tetratricopeptide (TPR) repeat protein